MKNKLFILITLSALIVSACSTKTSIIININDEFSKDDNQIYQKNSCLSKDELSQLDYESFVVIDDCYIKDNLSVFVRPYCGQDCLYEKIVSADPSSFEIMTFPYSKDVNNIYFRANIIEQADINSFQVVEKGGPELFYAKDNKHVYFQGELIEDASPESFEIISSNKVTGFYSKDESFVFCGIEKILNADPETFSFSTNSQGPGYFQDKNNIYYNCEVLK